jgi:hypothetical protein
VNFLKTASFADICQAIALFPLLLIVGPITPHYFAISNRVILLELITFIIESPELNAFPGGKGTFKSKTPLPRRGPGPGHRTQWPEMKSFFGPRFSLYLSVRLWVKMWVQTEMLLIPQ